LPTISNGIEIACNSQFVVFCLQLQLAFQLPAIYNQLVFCLQLQMAFKLPAIYNSLFFCLQFQLAFQLPTIYNQLAFNKTTSNGIQIACNLQFVAFFLPTISTGIPIDYKLQSTCS